MGLVIGIMACIIVYLGRSCNRKLAAATKVTYWGFSSGIMSAVLFMFIYQIRDKWCEYGALVSFFHLAGTAVLIVGAEIYHPGSLEDSTFETMYPKICMMRKIDDVNILLFIYSAKKDHRITYNRIIN